MGPPPLPPADPHAVLLTPFLRHSQEIPPPGIDVQSKPYLLPSVQDQSQLQFE